jgi:hypothetical protein
MRKLTVLTVLALASTASAGDVLKAHPIVYDPHESGIITAAWRTGVGLPDAGDSNHGLVLEKAGPIEIWAAAFAVIRGGEGEFVELGFDYEGYCGAGSPRFNVYTDDGRYFFFGCAYGVHTAVGDTGFTRVVFTLADASPADGGAPMSADAKVTQIDLVQDEGHAATILDNINVNGELIGKPGNVR